MKYLLVSWRITLLRAIAVAAVLIVACAPGESDPSAMGVGVSQQVPSPTPTPIITLTPAPPSPTPTPQPPRYWSPQQVPPLTLDDIFSSGRRDLTQFPLDPGQIRTLVATGDVIPARYVDVQIRDRGNDFLYPFAETTPLLRDADLTLINLEAPLIANCPLMRQGFTFCGQRGFVDALVYAGVDVASLENNHITNYGPQGVAATKELLTSRGIDYADRSNLVVRDVRGLKFGFLAFNGVGEYIDRRHMTEAIEGARGQVDALVVSFHWGREYVSVPDTAPGIAPDDPVEIAHLALDAGADLIIGNHPHWVQAVEIAGDQFVAYAHGNFIFDQMWSLETRLGVVGRYAFYGPRLVKVEYIPIIIENYAQPRPLAGEEAQAVLDTMRSASQELAQRLGAATRATTAP